MSGMTERVEWWNNPERKCRNDPSFSEADLRQQKETERMIYLCLTCPVLRECHRDALTNPHRKGTIQGGRKW